ncbi:hypothetical protein SAMN02910400_02117 [Lachnospiraceae bacterium C10]|nr:hypothetical protein SAMN02910400_02117 [Lachnospiraceae bacterium C10]
MKRLKKKKKQKMLYITTNKSMRKDTNRCWAKAAKDKEKVESGAGKTPE